MKNTNTQIRNNELKLCTLSGTSEIGRNCNFIELGDEIVIVDAGYSFPGQEMYGIDYLIPNFKYLKKNKHKVKAILITHGHLDHTGALRWMLPELDFPPVYAGAFAKALIEAKLEEYDELKNKTKIFGVTRHTTINIGKNFRATFIGINHSIPDAFSIFLESPEGNVFFSGDYKIDTQPTNELEADYEKLKSLRGKIDLALMESTNASKTGKSPSETEVYENLEKVIVKTEGRVIVAAFASLLTRLYSLFEIAKRTNRKIVISGRSLEQTISIASNQGYIKIPEGLIVTERSMQKYKDNELMILCTGSQAERFAALNRISLNEHKYIKIKQGDLVIMSSSEIPENVSSIEKMTDRLIALGADLLKDTIETKIHSTGHGNQEDMKIMYDLVQPNTVMPIHGPLTFRYFNKKNYVAWGMKDEDVLLTDDGLVWIFNGRTWRKGKPVDAKPILIDGLGVGDTGEIVLKDRKQLSEYGMFIIVLNMSTKTKRLMGRPQFVSRGFIYMKQSQEMLKEIQTIIYDVHRSWIKTSTNSKKYNYPDLKERIEKEVGKYIYKKTEREPIILIVTV
ncbi:MAG: beta-lactamase [candidate division WS6 bacterium GW2011_GWC1_33_20]|uniref:RNA-metabolising metallo-beta-lactamase n=2 Tax=Candidatus Dojkabacteria TaxID=74243 RepID=A0A0G0AVE0_9BACT|nr:MAG: beta-lactamase [candidate division WS6 bacterium GW2011_GWE2_33_157]KKP44275.1 MAG: beta-lactamase [candidate division WS6 bacterium GW2011_GWC1_33_20]KKP45860.1 MAG: beta-lactamase [candidate division WS6 bacterium GW2011_GWF1_33_233]KKP55143.1 MAG: beta-lactamase [candidate division WS6 bacterium GW2011_WS6_33_547]KKP55321.1 MAG: RNA-metabolising metallo-beta-lactamase [candidate division WS6 bacterium GW2011_GWB1_33_6]KKP57148.1 MAG: RNA-metabolising metallo-beta-lactamase [candidat